MRQLPAKIRRAIVKLVAGTKRPILTDRPPMIEALINQGDTMAMAKFTAANRPVLSAALILSSVLMSATATHAASLPECSDPVLRRVVSDAVSEAYELYVSYDGMKDIGNMLTEIPGAKGNAVRKSVASELKISINDVRVCGVMRENDNVHVSFLTVIFDKSGWIGRSKWEGEIHNLGLPVKFLPINSDMARK